MGPRVAAHAYSASLFYAITYVLTGLGVFGVILLLARKVNEVDSLADLRGPSRRSPWFALLTLLMALSLAGLPPTVGFQAKLSVLSAVIDAGMPRLPVTAVGCSLVGAFYYLRVVKMMYFDPHGDPARPVATMGLRALLSFNGLMALVLGLFPVGLMKLCDQVIRTTLAS
ncbi:proton-conducting transporter transmembrane domain-containing protein [Burkholderia pseudomallei]|uniref:proton-conducting transporter transmembrane domain-containing protein n=1 Tax=Burkholderia pseudomallei TaxID=28450 RepID=UPI0003D8ADC0|nr:proton-conducting transporter membrane subunit [Burkholderia pseudomallei]AHE30864.1 NADH-Ubiquinone/plastoquinone (complex I), various chains family protein [Burkholderia pseudomallei NCTC 13178]KGU89617.1 NADH-Ubiquinone/plastoquinone (complex I), various chains family protein [Burkholderia pseudomallei MSHR4372]